MSSRISDRGRAAAALVLVVGLSGCALHMDTPDEFLVIEDNRTEIKAITTDSALLWARTFDDPYEGDLAFWSQALFNDLVDNRGYVLKEQQDVIIGSGEDTLSGREMLFEVAAQGAPQRYLLFVFFEPGGFLDSDTICTVEFVGQTEPFEAHADAVRRAVRTLGF